MTKFIPSPQQAQAITHRGGHLRIVACAGSGKTESLARRIASLVQEGIEPSDIDPSVNTFEELFNKYKFSKLTKLLFEAQYNPSKELESALYGGENTSPNTKAAKRIQSRFRGNKDRKVAKRKKEQKKVDDFREILNTNLGDTENVPDDVMRLIMNHSGRGKKKKSKNKKHKSRSKSSKKRRVKRGG